MILSPKSKHGTLKDNILKNSHNTYMNNVAFSVLILNFVNCFWIFLFAIGFCEMPLDSVK